MKFLVPAMVIGVGLRACLAATATYPVACSAFDQRGDAAKATIAEQKLNVQIVPAGGGRPLALSASTADDGLLGCKVFFDRENHFVAVGASHLGLTPGPLRIVVVDLSSNKLISNFVVQPNTGLGTSLRLGGFFRGNATLVVLGSAEADHPTRTFITTLFGVKGEQKNPPETRTLPAGAASVGNVGFADAAHNRLWFKSSPQFCPLRSVPLVGNGPEGVSVDEAEGKAVCDVGSAIAYPTEDILIAGISRDDSDLITRVDLAKQRIDEIELPKVGEAGSYTAMGRGLLSPDGKVFAVSRNLVTNSPLGDAHSHGSEVDLVEVSPLKVLGKVRLKPDTDPASLSIDHRNGAVIILSFANGRWNSENLKTE